MKKLALLLISILAISLFAFPSEEILIKLPVRVLNSKNLEQKDFQILINGSPQSIVEFYNKNRSIDSVQSDRLFAISFDVKEYSKPLSEAISYFIQNIATPSDFLLVRSPLHIYQINLATNKDDIIKFIDSNLEKDIVSNFNDKSTLLKALNRLILELDSKLDSKKATIGSIQFFINYFNTEWNMLTSKFVLSNLEQFAEITSQLSQQNKNGDKWLIHFHEREATPLLSQFNRVHTKIKNFTPSITGKTKEKVPALLESLDKIEKILRLDEYIPSDIPVNNLLAANINFNVLFLPSQLESSDPTSIDYGFDSILKTISLQTGGIDATPTNLIDALNSIKIHPDYYYELVFPFGGVSEDKNIEIKVPPSSGAAFYKNKFKKDEFNGILSDQNLSITGFNLQNNLLKFTVSGIQLTPGKENLIHIDIRLIDDQQTVIFETANNIKPAKDSLSISITIPPEHKGYFKLLITAKDPTSSKTCEFKEYVKIQI